MPAYLPWVAGLLTWPPCYLLLPEAASPARPLTTARPLLPRLPFPPPCRPPAQA